MSISFNSLIKETIVSSIKNGLSETQTMYNGRLKRITNAKHFVKMDEIANSVIQSFEHNSDFNIITLKRGSYEVLLLHHINTDTLFSFMSHNRFQDLLNRKDFSHVHYLDALVNFNDKLNYNRMQMVIDDSYFEQESKSIESIKEQVKIQLGGIEPNKYVTIVFEMDTFRLVSVEAILTSEYLEIVEREDWSEFIEIDYNDINYDEINIEKDTDELTISLKPNVVRNDDISEENITPKTDTKENQN